MMPLFKPLLKQSFGSTGIYLLIIALSLAISATTALKFSNDQVRQAVALQAASMQAADLVLSDNAPIAEQWKNRATALNLKQSTVTAFGSMAHTRDQFVMVNVRAIDQAFPLRGELRVRPQAAHIQPGEIWLSQRAMDLLKVRVGDSLNIADGSFRVSAVIEHDSSQELGFSAFSPTVMIAQEDVAATHAIQVGSRIDYRLLMAGEARDVQRFEQAFKTFSESAAHVASATDTDAATDQPDGQAGHLQLRNAMDANARLMKPMQNLDTFLQLANILTILLCGIAIALTSQRYLQQNQDHIALIRCMGGRKNRIFQAYLALLMVVVFIAMFVGSLMGFGLGYVLLQFMLQLIPALALQFSMLDLLTGPLPVAIFTSAVVLAGFVLPSLWQLLNTPPVRVIRQQEKSVRSLAWMFSTGTVSLIVFSLVLTENVILTALVIAAVMLLSGLLYSLVWLLLKSIKALKNQLAVYVRVPSQTALQITALALGLSLITVLAVLRTDLLERWQQQLPEGTPNQFIYGLAPFDVAQFQQQLQHYQWQSTPLYPNVRGRLVAKNGQPFAASLVEQNNSLRRELNLTQADQYPQDNQIIKGTAGLPHRGGVSVEEKLASALAINIGDQLTFSLPEGQVQATVVNLRTVEWQSFNPNFFFIFAPGTLDENAGSYLGSFYVPPQQRLQLVSMIQQFPGTVFIDVSLILDEIKRLVNILVQIIGILAVLVSVSGFLVLIACINLMMDERKREVALLRSFGSSRRQLKNMLSLEIGFIGLLSGLVSCLFAEGIGAVAAYRMKLELQLHWEIWVILPLVMTVLCVLIGRYRLSYLSDLPPLQSLREISQ
ncbi:ABC transporter permease [Acinetobacter sp. WZC-1]|uniref:ABC transporter permease n=1 Tax=Acinetobacter sp. WZC-1 TaxID=3459034 RepID=UPI00403D91C8